MSDWNYWDYNMPGDVENASQVDWNQTLMAKFNELTNSDREIEIKVNFLRSLTKKSQYHSPIFKYKIQK